jgi:teichuronic acid biosynthesis glycosyltransferase TuaC
MKILTFTTLFPNAVHPHHGIFTETTLRHQLATAQVRATVVAPVPWFPSTNPRFGRYGSYARVPRVEQRIGVDVHHPRYVLLPKAGMHLAPLMMAQAALPVMKAIAAREDFDVIDAHYFYPDGVAAALLGAYFKKPVVISALGTDINLIPKFRLARGMIKWAGRRSAAMITVCDALKREMVGMGMEGDKIFPLRNGVDLQLFAPRDKPAARRECGVEGFTLLSVGHLDPRKGHDRTIGALRYLDGVRLVIIGGGAGQHKLEALARAEGVFDRVTFVPPVAQAQLCTWYSACDALVLASSREGWANVLLEAMACGTPVVASNVWGTPEVIRSPDAGVLLDENSPQGIAAGVLRLRAQYPKRTATRRYAEQFDWSATTAGQLSLFRQAIVQHPFPQPQLRVDGA